MSALHYKAPIERPLLKYYRTALVLYVWRYPKCHLVMPDKGKMAVIGA